MARTDPQINIRIPAELKAAMEQAGKNNNRSMNAEIIARLEASMKAAHIAAQARDQDPLAAAYFAADTIELYAKVIRSALIHGKLKSGELPPLQDGDEALANYEPQALKIENGPAPEHMLTPFESELIERLRDMTPEMREAMMTLAKRK
jgi:hypothetical protein